MALKIYDPKINGYFEEQVAGDGFLRFLYDHPLGRLPLSALIKRKLFQKLMGAWADNPISRKQVDAFVKKYDINLSETVIPPGGFASFNDFFTRALKPEARPVSPAPLISPGDGRLRYQLIEDPQQLIQAKGMVYSLSDLIQDLVPAKNYLGGSLFTLRLNPTDYHRYHYPCQGEEIRSLDVPGAYYSVNPRALKTIPALYLKNRRRISLWQSKAFGQVLFVAVGATSVGSIRDRRGPGPFRKGEEKGHFAFGGSSLLLILPALKNLELPQHLLDQSALGYESKIHFGESLATIKGLPR